MAALALGLCFGCAGYAAGKANALQAIGTWDNLRLDRKSRSIADAVQTRRSPAPDRITFRKDQSFEAIYSPRELAAFARSVGESSLTSPVEGTFTVRVDLAGIPWIRMEPGAPTRRLSIDNGILVLHKVGQEWTAEKYRRVPASSEGAVSGERDPVSRVPGS